MGKVTGFLEFDRLHEAAEKPQERLKHWHEFVGHLTDKDAGTQGARCMDCGTPFCMSGCPINNIIPDWNDLVYRNQWHDAIERLHAVGETQASSAAAELLEPLLSDIRRVIQRRGGK